MRGAKAAKCRIAMYAKMHLEPEKGGQNSDSETKRPP
jgi:hypothetical protein